MPLFDLFWSMMWFFLWIAWISVLFSVIGDIFRSHDMGGFAKAIWVLVVILVPWLGILFYLIARGDKMADRQMAAAAANDRAARSYIQEAAGVSSADELKKLSDLKSSGVLSDGEYQAQKAKLLA